MNNMKHLVSSNYKKILDPDYNLVTVPRFMSEKQNNYTFMLSLNNSFQANSWKDIYDFLPDYDGQYDQVSGKSALISDLTMWTMRFVLLTNKKPSIRLEVQDSDSCRVFHEDHNFIRMIITLYGPTTEFVAENNCNRNNLCKPWSSWKEQNSNIVKNQEEIIKYPVGWVAFLKGNKNLSNTPGVIHRSPILSDTNQKRVVFIVD